MKQFILLCLVIFCQSSAFSQHQGVDRFHVDSLQFYNFEQNTYTFYLVAGSQGLFVDQIEVVWLPEIRIRIINNTGKVIENDFRERDGHMMWLRSKWNKTLQPGEEMILKSAWSITGSQPKVWLNRNIDFNYQIDSTSYRFSIKTWGEFVVDVAERKAQYDKKLAEQEANANLIKTDNQPKRTPEVKSKQAPSNSVKTVPVLSKVDSIQVIRKKSFYQGEQVNKMNRKKIREGKWIVLYANNRLKTVEFYSGKDFHWDSAYFYYETTGRLERKHYHLQLSDSAVMKREYNDRGTLVKTYLWNGKVINEPDHRTYYPSGAVLSESYPYPSRHQFDYYENGAIQKYTSYNSQGKIDTIQSFYESGILKELQVYGVNEKPQYIRLYDEQGDLISNQDVYHRTHIEFKYLSKSDSMDVVERYYNGKHIWTDRGTRKEEELWNGTRTFTQEGAHTRVFVNGKENGIYFEGNWVNRYDSLGRQGKWYTFYPGYEPVSQIAFYTNNLLDSVYGYYESGAIRTIRYYQGEFSSEHREITNFGESSEILYEEGGFAGDTVWVSYFPSGEIHKMRKGNKNIYEFERGNQCSYTIEREKRVVHYSSSSDWSRIIPHDPNTPKSYGPYFDFYKNCVQYKRITSKYFELPYDANGEELVANPYQIEKGTFKDDQLYNGIREYYDTEDNFIRSIRVFNGKELK